MLKAIEKASETKTQIFIKIKEMVLDTCKEIMRFNEEFRKKTVSTIVDFHNSPILRTADVVPSIRVLLSQLYTFMQLDNYQQYLPEGFELNQQALSLIFRYAMEEQMRRSLPHQSEPLTKSQILKILFPSYQNEVTKIMEVRAREIEEEYKLQGDQHEEGSMYTFKEMANVLRMMDSKKLIEATPQIPVEEEKKVEMSKKESEEYERSKGLAAEIKKPAAQSEDTVALALNQIIDAQPWNKSLEEEKS